MEDDIKLGPKWIEWDGVDWIYVSHDKDQSRRVVNMVAKRRITAIEGIMEGKDDYLKFIENVGISRIA